MRLIKKNCSDNQFTDKNLFDLFVPALMIAIKIDEQTFFYFSYLKIYVFM